MTRPDDLDGVARDVQEALAGKPLSVEDQWQAVDDWYRYLEDNRSEDRPFASSFNEAWDELDSLYQINGEPIMKRGSDCRAADTPLATLSYYVDMGFYPPPELLLALNDAWQRYITAGGQMTLEEAFFGPAKKGSGNYAKRKHRRFRLFWLRMEFDRMLRDGKARLEIAEELSSRLGGKPDADSILRMMRGFNGLFARHAEEKKAP